MKFITKEGDEIECTPEEYIQLKKLETKPKYSPKEKKNNKKSKSQKIREIVNSGKAHNTTELIREMGMYNTPNNRKRIGRIFSKIYPKHSAPSHWQYQRSKHDNIYKRENKQKKENKKINKNLSEAEKQKRARSSFIFSRANSLMKNNHEINRQKAFIIASQEWFQKAPIGKVGNKVDIKQQHPNTSKAYTFNKNIISKKEEQNKFPEIPGIEKDFNIILKGMIANCIKTNQPLTYDVCSPTFDIRGKIEWNEFLVNIIKLSSKISKCFNVENRFKIIDGYTKSLLYK